MNHWEPSKFASGISGRSSWHCLRLLRVCPGIYRLRLLSTEIAGSPRSFGQALQGAALGTVCGLLRSFVQGLAVWGCCPLKSLGTLDTVSSGTPGCSSWHCLWIAQIVCPGVCCLTLTVCKCKGACINWTRRFGGKDLRCLEAPSGPRCFEAVFRPGTWGNCRRLESFVQPT